MRGIVWFAVAAFIPLAAVQAETLTLCGEKTDYQPAASDAAKGRDLVGVWVGDLLALNVPYSVDYKRCVAFAIEGVSADGKVRARHVAGGGAKNLGNGATYHNKPVVRVWNGELTGSTLRFARSDGTTGYEFPVSGSRKMEGRFITSNGYGRVWLTKQ